LIDGSGRRRIYDSTVIIDGDTIIAVGSKDKIKIPNGAKVIDAHGLVLSPGFIDTHNHSDRGWKPTEQQRVRCLRESQQLPWARMAGQNFLSVITSVSWKPIRWRSMY